MKPWLVGEQNPYSDNPAFDLYCEPPLSAGGRLFKVLGYQRRRDYLDAFDRQNLLERADGRWSVPLAREKADWLLTKMLAKDAVPAVILLGAKVTRAFGRDFIPFTTIEYVEPRRSMVTSVRGIVLPHPSGLSRAWNAPGAADKAKAMIMALVESCREAA